MEATEIAKLVELEGVHWWYLERRALLRKMVVSGLAAPAGQIAVDIGSAGGGNTLELEKLGMFAVCIEYGEVGARVARDGDFLRFGAMVGDSPLQIVPWTLWWHSTCWNTLTTTVQPLRRCGACFDQADTFLLAVPADMRLWSDHDLSVGHVRRYSRAGLVSAVQIAGFTLDGIRSWNVLLRPLVAMHRGRSKGSDLHRLNRVLNATLRLIVALERRLPWLHRRSGVSLLLSAHRPK